LLTKDLLKYKKVNGYLKPSFIDTYDESLLALAKQLLFIYNPDNQYTKKDIDEHIAPVLSIQKNPIVAKGLNKLILDRCEFSNTSECNYPELRKEIFTLSAKMLKVEDNTSDPISKNRSVLTYRQKIIASVEQSKRAIICHNIYSDLPDNETLTKIKKITPKELLERYNCSLVQSLLLHSGKLTIIVEDPEPAKMRKLLKYLKFFRLLVLIKPITSSSKRQPIQEPVDILQLDQTLSCHDGLSIIARPVLRGLGEVERATEEAPRIRKPRYHASCSKDKLANSRIMLEIDGPMNLFENTKKYGLQLASFFPAVCTLSKWKISSEVKLKSNTYKLSLNEKSGIKSHYHNFSSYIPEEYTIFYKLFKEKIDDWKIVEISPFLDTGNQELIFPDFSFMNTNETIVHIEFFHRWHASQLLKRIEHCNNNPDLPLIIGVDRFLYNKPEIKNILDTNCWFSKNGILFRDFPGVDRIHKKLNDWNTQ
jgi:uncharacterized protein